MSVAISTGPLTHLDHLAPLCSILDLPLIVTDLDHFELAKNFYPMIDLRYLCLSELSLEYIARSFDTILTCGKFWALELRPLLQLLHNKIVRFIFVPHGYSDKEELLDAPVDQDIKLVYTSKNTEALPMGNLRLWFYQQHKDHFDQLAAGYFSSKKQSVLYAPTWKTKATSTSFFEQIDQIIDKFSSKYHLLIKPHPLLEENHPSQFHHILEKHRSRATFIENFPLIYPLLEKTEIYLGDYSSIGYDFLVYNRPMYFLKKGGKLQNCGKELIDSITDRQEELKGIRMKTYLGAFGTAPDIETLKRELAPYLTRCSSR